MTKDEAKTVCVQPAQDLRSFPEAADGRPMPPMGDELMTAGLNCEDARFVAIQLAQNGLTLVSMTQNTTTPDLIKRMERIVRSEYAHRDHLILDCDLGQITFGDVRDLCDAAEAERDALKAENERLIRVIRLAYQVMRECGWQLVPACAAEGSDGIIEAACAEIEEEFGDMLRADGGGAGQ